MQAFLNRLREPSTWAGLATIASMFPTPGAPLVQSVAIAIAGALAVGLPEHKG